MAARWFLNSPPTLVNVPPANTFVSSAAKLCTALFIMGFQLFARPSLVLTAAAWCLDCPPIIVKLPPTYRVVPDRYRAFTEPFGSGFQLVDKPLLMPPTLSAANRFLLAPPIKVKAPPTYTFVPLIAKLHTELFALGFQLFASPSLAFSAAILALDCPPMLEK